MGWVHIGKKHAVDKFIVAEHAWEELISNPVG